MQQLVRFARYWDLIANSGRFAHTLPLILRESPFANFMRLSNWLYATTDATNRIALERLAVLVRQWLVLEGMDEEVAAEVVRSDYAGQANTKLKRRPYTRRNKPYCNGKRGIWRSVKRWFGEL